MGESMTSVTDLAAYNYMHFDQYVADGGHEKDEAAFRACFHVGEKAEDFTLLRLDDGAGVRLADLWKSKPLVMEFGSFTWPYCSAEGPLLDAGAARHPEVNWAFIYTREAHPGEDVPHHDSFDRKLANARLLRDEIGISRPILVDDLTGTVHRRYGSMPNMTWVIDRGGRVAYRANWTSAANVEAFLARYLAARADRSRGAPTLYETEQLEFRQVDPEGFNRRLLRNGPRAVAEFSKAMKLWGRPGW
jgi:hypothetical protein